VTAPPTQLHLTDRTGTSRVVTVDVPTVVGRVGTDIVLDDAAVSRAHCRFTPTPEGLVVEDLGSRNGTTVGGRRLDGPTVLRAGDVVTVGDTTIVVLAGDGSRPSTEEPARVRTERKGGVRVEARPGSRGERAAAGVRAAADDAWPRLAALAAGAAGRTPTIRLIDPYVDEATWACGAAGCAGTLRRTPEVVDCWFDSGAMPFAQWHYPFENGDKVAVGHPADFISEGVDQTRGWFYALLAISTMHVDKAAYRAVVSNDMVLDAKGKKMSKSRGNAVDPMALVARFGADVPRWYLLATRPVWLPVRFDEAELVELRNRLFGTLASTYAFFALYANADGFDVVAAARAPASRPAAVFDRWLLSRCHRLVRDVTIDLQAYETSKAGKRIVDFVVEDLSNWYVRRNRRRFWKGAMTPDKREGYATLRTALLTVVRLMAPFAPFLPDTIHRALLGGEPGADHSVHLAAWPVGDLALVDDALEAKMEALRTVVSLGHAARNRAGHKVRRPLARLTTGHSDAAVMDFLADQRDVVLDELNVKALDLVRGFEASASMSASLQKKDAARRLAALTQPTEEAVARLDAAGVRDLSLRLARDGVARLPLGQGREAELFPGDVRFVAADAAGGTSEFAAGILIRLDTTLTPALVVEGLAREAVHALQTLRKGRGLAVTDRVRVRWKASGPLAAALHAHAAFLAEEILAVAFAEDPALDPAGAEALDVDGEALLVALEVAAR
jgi:isoleucyl-tRNA synthetase